MAAPTVLLLTWCHAYWGSNSAKTPQWGVARLRSPSELWVWLTRLLMPSQLNNLRLLGGLLSKSVSSSSDVIIISGVQGWQETHTQTQTHTRTRTNARGSIMTVARELWHADPLLSLRLTLQVWLQLYKWINFITWKMMFTNLRHTDNFTQLTSLSVEISFYINKLAC